MAHQFFDALLTPKVHSIYLEVLLRLHKTCNRRSCHSDWNLNSMCGMFDDSACPPVVLVHVIFVSSVGLRDVHIPCFKTLPNNSCLLLCFTDPFPLVRSN